MKCNFYFLFIVLSSLSINYIEAQQSTPNKVDSLGLKQGMWQEFKIPFNLVTKEIGIKVPDITSEYYYLTKDKDRKYFPIIESIGEYINGLKSGIWTDYYGDGRILSEIEYGGGIPCGKCRMFWGNGVLKEEFIINGNDSVRVTFYDDKSNLIIEKMVLKISMIKTIYEN